MKGALKILGVAVLAVVTVIALLLVLALSVSAETAWVGEGLVELAVGWLAFVVRHAPLLRHHVGEAALSLAGVAAIFFATHAAGRRHHADWRWGTSLRVTALATAVVAAAAAARALATNARKLLVAPAGSVRDMTGFDMPRLGMAVVHQALQMFLVHVGRYPTTAEGLGALLARPDGLARWRGPYIKAVHLSDAWGERFAYQSIDGGKTYRLASAGPDGEHGSEDDLEYPPAD